MDRKAWRAAVHGVAKSQKWLRDWTELIEGMIRASQVALVVKHSPAIQETWDVGLIPGLGRVPGGGHGNPLQYSCLENPMGKGAWQATVHRVSHDWSNYACTYTQGVVKKKKLSTLTETAFQVYATSTHTSAFLPKLTNSTLNVPMAQVHPTFIPLNPQLHPSTDREMEMKPVSHAWIESWTIKKAEHQITDAFELWCWRRFLRVPLTARRSNQSILRKSVLNIHWKDWCWSWNSNTSATWCEELTHWKRPWCWERLKAGGEGDDRGWDGWMVSLTPWTWVWASPGSWWGTGKPGMLQSMGSKRVRCVWTPELH